MVGHGIYLLRTALWVMGLGAIAASCGDGVISQEQILTDIPAAILPDHPELISDIECRPEITLEPSTVSQCSATLADKPISFTVTPTNDRSDAVEVALEESVIETRPLIADARRALRADLGAKLVVDCDTAAVIVAEKGTRIACTAFDENEHQFWLRLLDEAGSYRIDLS